MNLPYHIGFTIKKKTMKFTSDLQWNLLCFKQCCLFWMWVIPKAFLSSSSDAIWIQNKTNSEHKKKHNEKKIKINRLSKNKEFDPKIQRERDINDSWGSERKSRSGNGIIEKHLLREIGLYSKLEALEALNLFFLLHRFALLSQLTDFSCSLYLSLILLRPATLFSSVKYKG